MKANKLQNNYSQFGNKGAVWFNQTHIAKNNESTTLCGTPMLSSNCARIEKHEDIGCPKCLAIYGKPDTIEWNTMMHAIQHKLKEPVIIPERFANYMIEHFTNCLPPIVWGNDYVLCSEPYSFDEESELETYIGFFKQDEIYYGVITTVVKFNALRRLWVPSKS